MTKRKGKPVNAVAQTPTAVDNDAIDAFAQFALSELRSTGLSDRAIISSGYLSPNQADVKFDNEQRRNNGGHVPAPAAHVKARMWNLLAN